MKKIQAYINFEGNGVIVNRFPDDKEHDGLNDRLDEFIEYWGVLNYNIKKNITEPGFYELEFGFVDDVGLFGPYKRFEQISAKYLGNSRFS
jgi:hypothetical protein